MKALPPGMISAKQVAERWNCHPSTAVRILERFGHAGMKSGHQKNSLRRFDASEVMRIEMLLRLSTDR